MSDNPAPPQRPVIDETPAVVVTESRVAGKDNKPVQNKPGPGKPRVGRLSLAALFLLFLAGLCGLAYFQLEQRAALATLQADYAALLQQSAGGSNQLASLQQAQQQMENTLQEELKTVNDNSAVQAGQLDTINRELVSTNLRIRNSGAGAGQDWMLGEAESLLRLAQQRLLVARDVRAAIGLFIASDDLLKQLNDPAVYAVREVLAQELATLQALPEVDVQGLYVQLGAQSMRIDSFAIVSDSAAVDFTVPSVAGGTAGTESDWLDNAIASLSRYFVVTRRDEVVTPLLTAEQEYLIRRSIQLQIEQARLALLRGQVEIYQAALDEALAAIAQRLQGEAGSRENLLEVLSELRNTPILVNIPPVNNTLTALRQILPAASGTPVEGGP